MTTKRPFGGKLRNRMLVSLTAFLLLVVGGCVLAYCLFARDYYIFAKSHVLKDACEYAERLDLADISDDEATVLESFEQDYTIRILIADEEMNLVYASMGFTDNNITRMVEHWISNRADEYTVDASAVHKTSLFEEGDSYISISSLSEQGSGTYYLCLFEDVRSAANTIAYFNQFMVVLLVITLLGGAGYAFTLSKQILRPIEQMDAVTGKIAEGDLSVRVQDETAVDELGDLTRQINRMANTIQGNLNRLENYNSALQRQNATMESFEHLQKQFVSQVTHELKTPLAIISTQAEMMEWVDDEEQRRYYCESIMEEVEKMSRLITDVLTMSLTEHSLGELILERIDLAEGCRNRIRKYSDWMNQRKLTLTSEIDEHCVAFFSWQHFDQILNNFVMNAGQHTPEGGRIRVTLQDLGSDFFLSVFNSGSPIREDDRDKVWTGYYHLKSLSHGNDGKSVGLGLFIVRDIVKTYAGECDFTNLDDGVLFWVKIPKNCRQAEDSDGST